MWRQSGANTDSNVPVPFLSLKSKASEENIFLAEMFIPKLCSGSRGQMAHPGIVLLWYFANGQVFLFQCAFLP